MGSTTRCFKSPSRSANKSPSEIPVDHVFLLVGNQQQVEKLLFIFGYLLYCDHVSCTSLRSGCGFPVLLINDPLPAMEQILPHMFVVPLDTVDYFFQYSFFCREFSSHKPDDE